MSKIAFLFPGQGAQKAGMGQDFYEKYPSARQVFDQASQWLSLDMKALCFEKNDRLNLTEYTQAALVTTCLAMEKSGGGVWASSGYNCRIKLGEYCAIAVSGGMSVKDAIVTVRKRGILMEHAVPAGEGSMAAVIGLDADKIQNAIAGTKAEIANYNCPGQIVITGPKPAVEEASVKLKEAGARRVLSLAVSGPFHSSLLQNAGKELEKRTVKSRAFRSEDSLCDQCDRPVCDRHQRDKKSSCKADFFLCSLAAECGKDDSGGCGYFRRNWSRKDFAGFMKKIAPEMKTYNIQNVEDLEQISDLIHSRK